MVFGLLEWPQLNRCDSSGETFRYAFDNRGGTRSRDDEAALLLSVGVHDSPQRFKQGGGTAVLRQ